MRVLLFMVALCACGVVAPEPQQHGRVELAIVGGTPSTGDLDVFMIDIRGNNGAATRCSATLIAPRSLLTAAHCVDPAMLGATSITIVASNAATEAQIVPGVNTVAVLETRLHPMWNAAAGLGGDLALCLLESSQPNPRAWNRAPLAGLGGEPVRVVGYGAAVPDGGTGTRRSVNLDIRQLTPDLISIGNFVDKGICHGDSGGPTLHTFGDGVERLIGVHSFTRTDDCLDGADTRVDAKAPFMLQWLADKEENCGSNSVCEAGSCATVDPDCVAVGSPCAGTWECRGRACISDPQHSATYCSRPCTADSECGAGLGCDPSRRLCLLSQLPTARPGEPCTPLATFCTVGSVCNGSSAERARCSQPCARSIECQTGQSCRAGFASGSVCFDPDPITLPVGRVELPAATGCGTAMGLAPGLLLFWLRRRRCAARGVRNCYP